ncbi:MAG TPA: enoyl-CoA hydratase/isomerase family protein [Xanthobacteraceae bacterium]
MAADSPEVLFERRGAAGIVTLNRPQALNAVTLAMVGALTHQLTEWERDGAVTRVIVTAAGDRAFSAGGDLRALFDLGRGRHYQAALTYWRTEYALNALIKRYRKPYVALIDGIVMGGGAGISIHGSHRVAGDRFVFAMPEVGIGFFPDVGATWFLPRLPGELGLYLALTGERLGPGEGVVSGVATHRVASERFPDLLEALCGNVSVDAVLGAFAEPAGQGPFSARRAAIDRLFAGDSVEGILARLDAEAAGAHSEADFARAAAASIRLKSPTSLKIALAQLRRGRSLDFAECMRTEFRIVSRLLREHDLYEGIRSVIIDKDQAPRWQPSSLEAVSSREVERYFEPQPDELALP